MNRPPLPSFFKIRLSIIVVVFLVFIFLIGVAKQALARGYIDTQDRCTLYYYTPHTTYYSGTASQTTHGELTWVTNDGPIVKTTLGSWTQPGVYDGLKLARCYWNEVANPNIWTCINEFGGARVSKPYGDQIYEFISVSGSTTTHPNTEFPSGPEAHQLCGNTCQQERDQLEQQCGAGNYYIDEETCEGDCKCNDNDEDGVCNACDLDPNNPQITNVAWVWNECKEPSGLICNRSYVLREVEVMRLSSVPFYETNHEGCSEAATCYSLLPYGTPMQVNGNCTPDNCNVCDAGPDGSWLDDLVASGTSNLNPNEQQPDHDDKTDQCREQCSPKGYMYVPGTDTCVCLSDSNYSDTTNDPEPTEGTPKPTEPPPTPETAGPNQAPGPQATDSEVQRSVDENTRSITQNTQQSVEIQAEINQNLGWVGENAKATADNTAKIEKSVDGVGSAIGDLGKDVRGLGNKISGVGDDIEGLGTKIDGLGTQIGDDLNELGEDLGEKLDQLTDELAGTNEPTEDLPEETPDSYSVDEHSWGDRTTQFLSDMRTTGLFAVPTDFLDAAPGGGSPELTINGGETYGVHTLSFADYSSGLIAIRTVIQLAFMWLAIRIVTLKR